MLVNLSQGSHASWKVLDFFLEKSRTWKVLENHFGPGKSWKKPFLAGAPPRTPLGELTTLPQTP